MSSTWFSKFSAFRTFPPYSGPYDVGTCDVELASAELDSPTTAEPPDETIGTVAFRIFYPCEPSPSTRPVKWVPSPQSKYGAAYARFMGAKPAFAGVISIFPQFLYMTRIPAHRNGKLLEPKSTDRWPVMIFSHGLGGSRNTYSHLLGSLSSYGIVVIAPDHRDGSSPISYVRQTEHTKAKSIYYKRLPHTATPEVYAARDEMLTVRLWELALIHDAILKMDAGRSLHNLDPNRVQKGKGVEVLKMFKDKLDVQRPGSIIWAGHSFGAATTVQMIKSTYWRPNRGTMEGYRPLLEPSESSNIVKQITSSTVAVLLDMWCLPLRSPSTRWLWDHPMPCYNASDSPAGGKAVLSILSEGFFKWTGNYNDTKRAVTINEQLDPSLRQSPYFFYPTTSAHLSQSDFGIVFPWLTRTVLKTEDPEQLLRLNIRAILQVLRENGYTVADSAETNDKESINSSQSVSTSAETSQGQDWRILDPKGGIQGWNYVDVGPVVPSESEHVEEDYKAPKKGMDEADVLDMKQKQQV